MSILQEYESIKNRIGEERFKQIELFLSANPQYVLSDVYYKESVWKESEEWMKNNGVEPFVKTESLDFMDMLNCDSELSADKDDLIDKCDKINAWADNMEDKIKDIEIENDKSPLGTR